MNVLVVDIGGSHVKFTSTSANEVRRFASGSDMTAERCIGRVTDETRDWTFEAVSLGYPGRVTGNGPVSEPGNLGSGWVGFDYALAFERPVRIVNDAVLQALGGYSGGRMLFLGLGTGLGTALITEHVVVPLDLGTLPWSGEETIADRIGRRGLEHRARSEWADDVSQVTTALCTALHADYVLLGGGNTELLERLPEGVRRGSNDDAFKGGVRLWEELVEPHDREPARAWRVLR